MPKKNIPNKKADGEAYIKDFFDMVTPSAIKFYVDHYICGGSYRSVWAIREYPPQTTNQAILARFGDKDKVTLHIYSRFVDSIEQKQILQNSERKNTMLSYSNSMQELITGEGNLEDMKEMLSSSRKDGETLLYCAVFIEFSAENLEKLREIQADVSMELLREKITIDKLFLRQKEGFLAVNPCGYNAFGTQFERVLPASSVANLYPFSYSGKTDPHGFYIGKDKFGSNIA